METGCIGMTVPVLSLQGVMVEALIIKVLATEVLGRDFAPRISAEG